MRRLVGTFLLLFASAAQAAPPGLRDVFPPALQRGVDNDVQIIAVHLAKGTEIVAPFAFEVKGGFGGSAEVCRFTIKPAADTPPGIYPVRLRTSAGISNLRLLLVTEYPVIRAKEPNGRYRGGKLDLTQYTPITWPCLVTGGRLSNDLDVLRFAAKPGDRLTLVTETRRLGLTPDPVLRLRDSQGKSIAYFHDTPGLLRDERLDQRFTTAGDYFLEMTSLPVGGWCNQYLVKVGPFDYARSVFPLGGRRGEKASFQVTNRDGVTTNITTQVPADPYVDLWRLPLPNHPGSLPWLLSSGDHPEITDGPNLGAAREVPWPVTINGRISKPGEEDLFRIAVKPGQHVRVMVEAFQLGSHLDGHLMVYDPKGKKLLAKNDDQTGRGNPDPGLTFEVPAGVEDVFIALRDTMSHGGDEYSYRLTIEEGGPDFYLWLGTAQDGTKSNEENVSWYRMDYFDTLNLHPGKETTFHVGVRRSAKENDPHYMGPIQGYQGPITLKAIGLPKGVTHRPATIPAGKVAGEMVFLVAPDAPKQPFEITILGEATRANGSVIRRVAERKLFLSDPQTINLHWNWRVQKLTCVTTK
jgi:hypothetical protein